MAFITPTSPSPPSRCCSCQPCDAPGITTPRRLPESQSALAVLLMLLALFPAAASQCALLRSLRLCVHPPMILMMSLPSPPTVRRLYMILGKVTGSCRHGSRGTGPTNTYVTSLSSHNYFLLNVALFQYHRLTDREVSYVQLFCAFN